MCRQTAVVNKHQCSDSTALSSASVAFSSSLLFVICFNNRVFLPIVLPLWVVMCVQAFAGIGALLAATFCFYIYVFLTGGISDGATRFQGMPT